MDDYAYYEGNYIKEERRHKKAKAILITLLSLLLTALLVIVVFLIYREIFYRRSIDKLVKREFETAYVNFDKLNTYKGN